MIQQLYEPFQEWALNGSIWIISDTHFDDIDCQFMDKNWINPNEQTQLLNKYPCDTLVILGDVGNPRYLENIRCRRKILITGNHDTNIADLAQYFTEIYNGPLLIAPRILLSHEPIYGLNWCVNIHGHDHRGEFKYNDEFGCKHINVAANVCKYTPISLHKEIQNGLISDIKNIHRITIDKATEEKLINSMFYQLTLEDIID